MRDFVVPYGTEEYHSEFVSSAAVSVAFGHDLQRHFGGGLDFPVGVFDHNPLTRQLAVKRLLFRR